MIFNSKRVLQGLTSYTLVASDAAQGTSEAVINGQALLPHSRWTPTREVHFFRPSFLLLWNRWGSLSRCPVCKATLQSMCLEGYLDRQIQKQTTIQASSPSKTWKKWWQLHEIHRSYDIYISYISRWNDVYKDSSAYIIYDVYIYTYIISRLDSFGKIKFYQGLGKLFGSGWTVQTFTRISGSEAWHSLTPPPKTTCHRRARLVQFQGV